MSLYRVHLEQSVSTAVEVEAESVDEAIELACHRAPSPINSTNRGIDASGEWREVLVEDVATGAEAWRMD